MHRLIQLSAHNWLKQTHKLEEYNEFALSVLADNFPARPLETWGFETWEKSQMFYPHALRVLDYPINSNRRELDRAELLIKVATYEYSQGRDLDSAARKLSLGLDLRSRILGPNDRKTLWCSSVLGECLNLSCRDSEAEPILRKTLEIQTSLFGLDDEDTLMTMQRFAWTLSLLSKLNEAEQICRELLRVSRATKRQRDRLTLTATSELARILRLRGKLHESETKLRKTIILQKELLGEDHETWGSMNMLTHSLVEQKKYVEAEEIARRILTIQSGIHGERHTNSLAAMKI